MDWKTNSHANDTKRQTHSGISVKERMNCIVDVVGDLDARTANRIR